MNKLFWCVALLSVMLLLAGAHKMEIDVFDLNTREKHVYVFGTITLEEGEKLSENDEIYFKLEAKDGPLPKLTKMEFLLLDSENGTTLVKDERPLESNTVAPTKLNWLTEADEESVEFFFIAVFTIAGDVLPSSSRARIEYNRQDDEERFPFHVTFDVNAYAPISEILSFNSTCLESRAECTESPYVISVQDLHTDLKEVSFTVRGGSRLEIDETTVDRIDCFINNNPVVAYLSGYKGRGVYTLTHRMYKGLDYTIRCPESVLVNRYDDQNSSIASMSAISADDNTKLTQNIFFSIQFDALFAQVYSSTQPIASTNTHAFYTRFPVRFEPDIQHPAKFNAQIEFTDIHPSKVEVIATNEKNEVVFYHTVVPEKDYYPFFDVDFKGLSAVNVTMVGTVDKSTVFAKSLVQSRLELQYKTPKMEDEEQIDVIVVGIGDIHVVTPLEVKPILEVTKYLHKSAEYAPLEFTIDKLHTAKYFSDLHLSVPAHQIEIGLNKTTAADPKVISCTVGDVEISAPFHLDKNGRAIKVAFKNIKLGDVNNARFVCKDAYLAFPKESQLEQNILHVEVVTGDLDKFDIYAQNILLKGVEKRSSSNDYDVIKYAIVAALGVVVVATAIFIVVRRIRKPNTDHLLLGDDEYHQIQ